MTEHLSAQRLDEFRQGALAPSELLGADDHLSGCETCRRRLAERCEPLATQESLRRDLHRLGLEEGDHLDPETLEKVVDHRLDEIDREIAQSHLKTCPTCAAEVRDLREFAAAMSVVSFPRFSPFRTPIRVAAAASVLVLFGWMLTIPLRRQVADLRRQVAELRDEAARPQSIVLALNEPGGPIAIDGQGTLRGLEAAPAELRSRVADVLRKPKIETPPGIAGLIGETGTLLGGEEKTDFAVLAPVGTMVSGDRPTFRWGALKGAMEYRVVVYDQALHQVAGGRSLRDTSWTPSRPLRRGGTYSWQATAMTRGGAEVIAPAPPLPEAKFAVLAEDEVGQLEQTLRAAEGSHLAAGLLYARSGLLDDAENELAQLLSANPTSSVARALLDALRTLRRNRQSPVAAPPAR